MILYTRGDTTHQSTIAVDELQAEPFFAEEIGFNIAIGFQQKNFAMDPLFTDGIVEIEVYENSWWSDEESGEI